ncbi:MAG: hypothetical protein Tsb0014_13260 [Pleurocapsa sp.]
MSEIASSPFTPEEIASEGIKPEEYQEIVRRLGRHPNKAELGMFGVMWSEHCCYKNSRPLLSQFPTTGERILVGPGENAGVVDLGNGLRLAFKIESHNHPSAVEPFQGAATGVGGILRDIFTMGARPIAILNSLRFGNLEDARTKRIFQGVVEGISHYGNCLIASETFIWRDDRGVHFDTIGNFVKSRLPAGETTFELLDGVSTLSYNPETQASCWQPVRRIFKRSTKQLVEIKTSLGRTLTVTPDHPLLILEQGDRVIKDAAKVELGDYLPLLTDIPKTVTESLKEEVLKGILRGDGSLTTKTNGNHAKVGFASTSSKLFEQVVMLLQGQGIVPYIYYQSARPTEIEGRKYERLPLWQLEINNYSGLKLLSGIFGRERDLELREALNKYNGDKYSFPRYLTSDNLAFVKIKNIETKNVSDTDVYDVEVDNTHLFVTTSGIVTHNCVGVPTVAGEVYFDKAYAGNPLVNAMALGLMETKDIVKSGASGIGNPVLYVGSTTGRDGMGGASFASAELTDDSMDDRPAVQVGDPFLEKSLIEACLEAFKTGAVVAAQDMGAAGLTCSTSEMADKGGVGIELDLDKIPARETGMTPYEYLLSESQERMLFVAQKGREAELIAIFHRWGLHAVVAGSVIEEPVVRILYQGEIAAEVTATALADDTPIYHRELLKEPPAYAKQAWQWTPDSLPACDYEGIFIGETYKTWNDILLQLLDTPTIASKRWIYRQYDHQVQNNTVLLPGGADAAVVRVRPIDAQPEDCNIGVAATTDCNSRYVYLNPYEGAKAAVAEAARNLSCVGAEPLAVTDNLNFGSPEKPVGYWQLANACRGVADACREMSTPVTGGNVSLYNETLDSQGNPQPIYPTPVIGMVGLIPDLTKICGQSWQNEGDIIYLLGMDGSRSALTLGASEYLAVIHNTVAGQPPVVNFALERQVQAACRHGIRQEWIKSAHDLGEGGLAVALAECCIGNSLGAEIAIAITEEQRLDEVLFGEVTGQIIVSVSPNCQSDWEAYLQNNLAGYWQQIGRVNKPQSELKILTNDNLPLINVKMNEIINTWNQAIETRLTV